MSGGHWQYKDEDLKRELYGWWNHSRKDQNRIGSYCVESGNPFDDHLLSEMMFDMLCLLHHRDWNISGDTSDNEYERQKRIFKKKWLGKDGLESTYRKLIKNLIAETEKECLKMLK